MSSLEPESGIWLHQGSWKHLNIDDYLICVAMVTMTTLMGAMHIVVHSSSNLIAPNEDVSRFSQHEIEQRVYGSKLVLVIEQMQCCTIWLVKACLLLMYKRMTALLPQHKIVLCVSGYTALGFVVMEILYFGVWCRPFNQYWAVPPSNSQCSAATNHLITNAVLNISSDLMIIAIPMPLLFKVKLPTKNKAILIGIFLIGTFNIIAAVLNKYYSFSHPFGNEWTQWYLRESYTAFLCANLPLTYPLIQRIFRLKSWSHHSYSGRYFSGSLQRRTMRSGQRKSTLGLKSGHGGISKTVSVNVSKSQSIPDLQRSESEERIYGPPTSRIFEQKTFIEGGESERNLWVPGVHMEMGPISPTSQKEGSVTTSGSIKSLEDAHIRR
ncbi:hypothetical protein N0V90_007037 [Kalmusia sp. IMI 367209]|nr:hypothetical protein N0V90_007037 [Kalmusia sp. IMI 367209]